MEMEACAKIIRNGREYRSLGISALHRLATESPKSAFYGILSFSLSI